MGKFTLLVWESEGRVPAIGEQVLVVVPEFENQAAVVTEYAAVDEEPMTGKRFLQVKARILLPADELIEAKGDEPEVWLRGG